MVFDNLWFTTVQHGGYWSIMVDDGWWWLVMVHTHNSGSLASGTSLEFDVLSTMFLLAELEIDVLSIIFHHASLGFDVPSIIFHHASLETSTEIPRLSWYIPKSGVIGSFPEFRHMAAAGGRPRNARIMLSCDAQALVWHGMAMPLWLHHDTYCIHPCRMP